MPKKPLVGTWYAVRCQDGRFLTDHGVGSFPSACLYSTRKLAREDATDWDPEAKVSIVDVRCRALSTKTKKSPKRTR